MKLVAALLLSCAALCAADVRVVLETEFGAVVLKLYPSKAPRTVANFLSYADAGFFNGGVIHRTVKIDNQPQSKTKIEVIQAGVNPARENADFAAIPLERTNKTGLKHRDGTISMARDGPDTATSSFFICIGDQPALDYGGMRNADGQGFAAFGKVVRGMDVVKKIQTAPSNEQTLTPPIVIRSVHR